MVDMKENNTDGDWASGASVHLSPSYAVHDADRAISRYKSLGLDLPPGNRLQTARKFLAQFVGTETPLASPSEELLLRIMESTRTCFEHYLIARSIGTQSGEIRPEHARKIGESLKGADTADNDANSIGRDTQFELFVGAILSIGGASVQIAEPDLEFIYVGEEVGVAAKRVKRLKQLRRRFNPDPAPEVRFG